MLSPTFGAPTSPHQHISSLVADDVSRLTGTSPAVQELKREIQRAGRCDSKVLITGESGAGKEVVARLIHECSLRRRSPMLAINCAGLPDSLLESTLFGHERGSFTGAYRDRPGLLATLHHGTLFMDEVCEMTPRMQSMLLRFLETGEMQRVGADKPSAPVNVRVIAATNRDMRRSVEAGEFREDLFFRLNVLEVYVPPLRERHEDLPALVDHFLAVYSAQRGIPTPTLAPCARERLMSHTWPGNVRELRNAIESAMLWAEGGIICLKDLPTQFRQPMRTMTPPSQLPVAAPSIAQTIYARIVIGRECFWSIAHEPFMARDITRHDVREVVRLGLQETRGNYRALVALFHMPATDYKRFLNFLRTFDCHVAFHDFRNPPVGPGRDNDDSRLLDERRVEGRTGAIWPN
jgi:transcriptional regulator with PAS, ATPase and Fis domain